MAKRNIIIDPLSVCSLYLEIFHHKTFLGQATGFTVKIGDSYYLITNKHVVETKDQSGTLEANTLHIVFHSSQQLGRWIIKKVRLKDDNGNALWHEHNNPLVDIAIIKIVDHANITIYPFDLSFKDTNMIASPAMSVSIIGYPLGIRTGGVFPVWKTGHIASDPDLDFNNLPALLIDATTRGGMSGSPVVVRQSNYQDRDGNKIIATGFATLFLGVYSGRVNEESEIGIVWRPNLIEEILENIT